MTEQEREVIVIKLPEGDECLAAWRKALTAGLKGFATFGKPSAVGLTFFELMASAAQVAEIDAHQEVDDYMAALRSRFGWLACLMPDWWTLRRFVRILDGLTA